MDFLVPLIYLGFLGAVIGGPVYLLASWYAMRRRASPADRPPIIALSSSIILYVLSVIFLYLLTGFANVVFGLLELWGLIFVAMTPPLARALRNRMARHLGYSENL